MYSKAYLAVSPLPRLLTRHVQAVADTRQLAGYRLLGRSQMMRDLRYNLPRLQWHAETLPDCCTTNSISCSSTHTATNRRMALFVSSSSGSNTRILNSTPSHCQTRNLALSDPESTPFSKPGSPRPACTSALPASDQNGWISRPT